jgi:hypothetical protein
MSIYLLGENARCDQVHQNRTEYTTEEETHAQRELGGASSTMIHGLTNEVDEPLLPFLFFPASVIPSDSCL